MLDFPLNRKIFPRYCFSWLKSVCFKIEKQYPDNSKRETVMTVNLLCYFFNKLYKFNIFSWKEKNIIYKDIEIGVWKQKKYSDIANTTCAVVLWKIFRGFNMRCELVYWKFMFYESFLWLGSGWLKQNVTWLEFSRKLLQWALRVFAGKTNVLQWTWVLCTVNWGENLLFTNFLF